MQALKDAIASESVEGMKTGLKELQEAAMAMGQAVYQPGAGGGAAGGAGPGGGQGGQGGQGGGGGRGGDDVIDAEFK